MKKCLINQINKSINVLLLDLLKGICYACRQRCVSLNILLKKENRDKDI